MPELWTPERQTPAPVIDGALRRVYARERAKERDRWRHIRDPHVDMRIRRAIAFDTATDGGRVTSNSISWSHTCAANATLIVGVLHGSVENMTGVTYNGVSLTQIDVEKSNHAGNYKLSLWYLLAAASGSNTVQVSLNSSSDSMPMAASYTGIKQSGFPDAYNNFTQVQASPDTENLTTIVDNCWMFWFGLDEFNTTETAGTGTTLRRQNSGYGGVFMADSNGSVGAAGSHSLQMIPTSGSDWMNNMIISMAPVVAGDLSSFIGEPQTGSSQIEGGLR